MTAKDIINAIGLGSIIAMIVSGVCAMLGIIWDADLFVRISLSALIVSLAIFLAAAFVTASPLYRD